MKYIISIIVLVLMTGCSTLERDKSISVLPDAPLALMEQCDTKLKEISPLATKNDVLDVVSVNYGTYRECKDKVGVWIEFYSDLKKKEKEKSK